MKLAPAKRRKVVDKHVKLKDEFNLEAKVYDRVWGKRDYEADVWFLDELFRRHHCKAVLDVGCGTGNHALRLAKHGYDVTGVDVSCAMIAEAKRKAKRAKVTFLVGDMKRIDKAVPSGITFDAAICLGSASQHLAINRHANAFLRGLHSRLKAGGLFVFDARNARKISEDLLNKLLVNHITTEDNLQLLVLNYNTRDPDDPNTIIWRPILLTDEKGKIDLQIREHKLRWFEPAELRKLLTRNSFEILEQYAGSDKTAFNENEHATTWLVTRTR
jgi:SAM-dependent methyltransferase